ncbi:chain length-determining protein [Granulosicoccus sp.]|nr:chain length-determining protein [Granulosicoccus sp.]
MQELIDTALDYIRGILRFRWTALLAAWVLALGGWYSVYNMPAKYQATARVFVDSNEVLQPLLRGITVQPDVNERVSLMSRTLLNRPNLAKLAQMTELDSAAATDYEKELLIDNLGRQVQLSGVRDNPSLYNLSYTSQDPQVARRVVQALITIFVESTMGDERADSQSAQSFLDQQIKLYETRLAEAEKRLSDFKRDNAGKMPGEAGGYYQRLDSAVALERSAQLELRETQKRRDSLVRQLKSESPTVLVSSGAQSAQSQLDRQLEQHYAELAALTLRYTDRHPKIAQLQDSIAALENQQLESQQKVSNVPASATLRGATYAPNPVYEGLRQSLTEAEVRIAELEVRVLDYQQQTEELNSTIGSIPQVEAQLQQLDRGYNIVKGQFEEVLTRRESARLSEQVDQTADDVQFRVIDPPFVPSRPSGPDRPLYSMAVLVAAIGAGAALAIGLSMLRPVFYSTKQIAAKTNRPVLGSVHNLTSMRQKMSQRVGWVAYIGLFFMLCFVCLILLATYRGFFDDGRLDFLMQSEDGTVVSTSTGAMGGLAEPCVNCSDIFHGVPYE